MTTKAVHLVAFCCMAALALATPVRGQPLATRSFDLLFQGDDPSERYDFLLTPNSLTPVQVQFTGYFENLNAEETGVRYGMGWPVSGTTWDGIQFTDELGVRLPGVDPMTGSTRVAIQFSQPIGFTPSEVQFWVEGLGPADRFRFAGELSILPVPEPGVVSLFLAGAAVATLGYRRRDRNHKGPRDD